MGASPTRFTNFIVYRHGDVVASKTTRQGSIPWDGANQLLSSSKVERVTVNHWVVGASPTLAASFDSFESQQTSWSLFTKPTGQLPGRSPMLDKVVKGYKFLKEVVVIYILVHIAFAVPYLVYNEKVMAYLNSLTLHQLNGGV